MKQKMQQFLMGSSLPNSTTLNIGWLLFRIHTGLSIAIHAGWPKMNTLAAPGWFNDQVAGLGFTFPSPAFWATLASWGEFVGGLCIAFGFLTRFNALQLAFQFFVISFLWYDKPEPLTGMYFQQTLFWGYVIMVFAGSGRFSIDHLLLSRKLKVQPVIIRTGIALFLLFTGIVSQAQSRPLNGSGKLITRAYYSRDFDKLDLQNLAGVVEVETGKPFAISVEIDDNLDTLLTVAVTENVLRIAFNGNKNNRLYIESTNIRIKISLPEISVLRQTGNNQLLLNGFIGRYLRVEHSGNGLIRLNGRVDLLDINKAGNGKLDASGLTAGKAILVKEGNGNLIFTATESFTIEGTGNGDVLNKGVGRPERVLLSGNGRLIYHAKSGTVI